MFTLAASCVSQASRQRSRVGVLLANQMVRSKQRDPNPKENSLVRK